MKYHPDIVSTESESFFSRIKIIFTDLLSY